MSYAALLASVASFNVPSYAIHHTGSMSYLDPFVAAERDIECDPCPSDRRAVLVSHLALFAPDADICVARFDGFTVLRVYSAGGVR